jgi:hypothetical protein
MVTSFAPRIALRGAMRRGRSQRLSRSFTGLPVATETPKTSTWDTEGIKPDSTLVA